MESMDFWREADRRAKQPASAAASGGEVHDELMFHFRALVNEKIAEGLSFEAAWQQAEQQFGPLRRYESECQAVRIERRLAWRIAVATAGALLAMLAAWWIAPDAGKAMKNEVRLLRQDIEALRKEQGERSAQVRVATDDRRSAPAIDLTGIVLGNESQPLGDATVLVILKTWPGGAYRQQAFTATTGDDGQFQLPGLIPGEGRYAVLVAALKDGFAFQSVYRLKEFVPTEQPDPIRLQLEPASHVTLVVRDGNRQPVPNAHVIPSLRKPRQGSEQLIYFQGSEPIRQTTDAEGRVRLNCFESGDRAEIYLQLPGDEWSSREFDVSADGAVVEVAS